MLLAVALALTPNARAAKSAPVSKSTAAVRSELGRDAVKTLYAAAQDPDPEVRAKVAAGWGTLANRAAIPLLDKGLQDANPDVRAAAAASLYKLGEVRGLTSLLDEVKPWVVKTASTPAEELQAMARDNARARAVLLLGDAAGAAAVDALENARKDPSGVVRDAANAALAKLGRGDSTVFLEALKDSDEFVRAAGARSLGLIGRDGAAALRKLAASDPSAAARADAAEALGAFPGPEVVASLAAGLKDPSARVRLACARSLARRPEPEAAAALKALLDKAPAAELALIATASLAERGEDPELSLAELTLGQRDPELKALALRTLAASRRPEGLELAAKAMRTDETARVRVDAALAVVARLRRPEAK